MEDSVLNPFAAFDRDVEPVRPASRDVGAAPPRVAPPAPALAPDALMGASLNPLVAAAHPLLAAAARLAALPRHADPAALRKSLAEGVLNFETRARQQGLPHDQVIAGRYILCTLLDESVASTPWGSAYGWATRSLLVEFHNEAWGGEKVFQLLSRLAQDVVANRYLLELLYVVLAFGFQGRYRVTADGPRQVEEIRAKLARLLRSRAGAPEKALSPRWQGQAGDAAGLRHEIPLWVLASAAALVLGGVFFGLQRLLVADADPLHDALQALDARAPRAAPAPRPAAKAPRLAQLLHEDIEAGRLHVDDLAGRSIVTLNADGLFEPASAEIAPSALPVFDRVAKALAALPGAVLVTGHTDRQPIHSLRYPSNYELSRSRAQAVQARLGLAVKPERLQAEGRADAEPIGDDATPAGRARNRRVEITLYVQPD